MIMAGAGLSAGRPTALPGWKPLNAAIARVLRQRLESALDRPGWLTSAMASVDVERDAGRFPPEYQAQVIEEMCGERYFQALQAMDVDVLNTGHAAVAALAAAGAIRAIVTTNFDRLLERALEERGVPYDSAYDEAGFIRMAERSGHLKDSAIPIVKVHGCVSDHRSLIDTLKQRKRGRSRYLEACLDPLHAEYWIHLGFSAADLEGDSQYLGLVRGATRSPGATYVAYPGAPELSAGAMVLMNAYGDRGAVVVADIADHLGGLCERIGGCRLAKIPEGDTTGATRFEARLEEWADALEPMAAGLCWARMAGGGRPGRARGAHSRPARPQGVLRPAGDRRLSGAATSLRTAGRALWAASSACRTSAARPAMPAWRR